MSNVATSDHNRSASQSALEALPHLTSQIVLMWGMRELDSHISRLLMDSRDGQRKGLPMQVAAELLFLAQCNKIVRAIDAALELKVSLKEAYQMIDSGDQARLRMDGWSDPASSRDAARLRPVQADSRRAARSKAGDGGGTFQWLGQLVFALVRNKWFLVLLFLVLSGRMFWTFAGVR